MEKRVSSGLMDKLGLEDDCGSKLCVFSIINIELLVVKLGLNYKLTKVDSF